MISHKYRFIFIHIPKCAGSSIRDFYFDTPKLDWRVPNYDLLYGWCPEREIHLQHATAKQLIETGLVKQEEWDMYFKFVFVRNPWDRAYSDYLWIMKDRKIQGTFTEYLMSEGDFKVSLTDSSDKNFRGDHVLSQTSFFDTKGKYEVDFIGKFECLGQDIIRINSILGFKKDFNNHAKKNENRKEHYSGFYNESMRGLVEQIYASDIQAFGYRYEDKRKWYSKFLSLI